MLSLAQKGYTKQQVMDILHMKKGAREVKYRYDLLDVNNKKKKTLTTVISATVSMAAFADIKRVATFEIADDIDIDWLSDRIRPVYMLRVDETWLEWPLGVFLLETSTQSNSNVNIREVEAYDLSKILIDDKLDSRLTIASGTSYTTAIKTILNNAGITNINIEASDKTLPTAREFEPGSAKLSVINKLLSEINYTQLYVDGYGAFTAGVYRSPSVRHSEYEYKDDELSVIKPGTVYELDLFNIPNKWVVVASNPESEPLTSTYTNDNPLSITSTVNRGRTIVDFRTIDNIADQDSLDAYVDRIAFNASQSYSYAEFITANMPHHSYNDVITLTSGSLGISGKYSETGWSMDLRVGGEMTHSVRMVVNI